MTNLNAHYRRNRYNQSPSSSARSNSNVTDFEAPPSMFSPISSMKTMTSNAKGAKTKIKRRASDAIINSAIGDLLLSSSDKEEKEKRLSKLLLSRNNKIFVPFGKSKLTGANNSNITSFFMDDTTNNDEEDPENDQRIKTNKVCRIVASADYKIPPLPNQQQNPNSLLPEIDALSHAMTHQNTRNRLRYMELIQKEYQNIMNTNTIDGNDDGNESMKIEDEKKRSIYDDFLYNEEEERKVVSTLRQSLEDSGFRLLTERDVELCEALNEGYLLRLSILPDVSGLDPSIGPEFYPELYRDCDVDNSNGSNIDTNGATTDGSSSGRNAKGDNRKNGLLYDGRILVYKRGYSQEVTKGRLFLPKIDYLQSSLVQRTAFDFAKKIADIERKISDRIMGISQGIESKIKQEIPERVQKTVSKVKGFKAINGSGEDSNGEEPSEGSNNGKRKNPNAFGRYYRSSRLIETPDTYDALSQFLVCGIKQTSSNDDEEEDDIDVDMDLYDALKPGSFSCKRDLDKAKSNGQTTISEQVQLLKRVSIANLVDFFSTGGRRRLIKSLFAQSELVEPTYEEVCILFHLLLLVPVVFLALPFIIFSYTVFKK